MLLCYYVPITESMGYGCTTEQPGRLSGGNRDEWHKRVVDRAYIQMIRGLTGRRAESQHTEVKDKEKE
jgi:hypothetical protein